METKQLELFKNTDFDRIKTFIKEYDGWYLFDNVKDREDFSNKTSNRYIAVCKDYGNNSIKLFGEESQEVRVCSSDIEAKLIGIFQYIVLSNAIRVNSKYVYNKKIGKLIQKNEKS